MVGLGHSELDVQQFVNITQATREEAERFLVEGTTLEGAIEDYFAAQAAETPNLDNDEEDEDLSEALLDSEDQDSPIMSDPNPNGPRTLDGKPAEGLPQGWGQPAQRPSRPAPSGGIATLFNTGLHAGLNRGGGPPVHEDDDDDDDDDRVSRDPQEFYAGGQNSGIAVQDPTQNGPQGGARGLVDRILKQAARNGAPDQPRASASQSRGLFGGSGNVLGSEDDPAPSSQAGSSASPAPSGPSVAAVSPSMFDQLLGSMMGGGSTGRAAAPQPPEEECDDEVQFRNLTFWRNGFSIEDGPLMGYDEPGNKEVLDAIHAGRAPPTLFGVRYNQPLQVVVAQRTNEDYRPPPKKPMKAFEGGGNRLGSSVPEVSGSGSSTPAMPGGFRGGAVTQTQGAPESTGGDSAPSFELDTSKATTSIQIRLGDGTRLVAKVNLTHTIGDLRNFVRAARSDERNFVLQTTFPSKELTDESETVEGAKLQNAVVIQRFV